MIFYVLPLMYVVLMIYVLPLMYVDLCSTIMYEDLCSTINVYIDLYSTINVCSTVQLLADVEDHLDITIETTEPDMKVPVNEFDGKVTYGQKRRNTGMGTFVLLYFNE